MTMKRWAVLYTDGDVFTHEHGSPFEARRHDVQMVFMEDDLTGARIVRSSRGFWIWEDAWIGVDDPGFWQHILHHPQPLILFGRYLTHEDWQQRMKAKIDETLGILKSAWYREERDPDVLP